MLASITPIEQARTPAHYARRYAAIGWHVLPVYWLEADRETGEVGCACGNPECRAPGKHPMLPGWQQASTTDAATIATWWDRWPKAHIGIHLSKSRLVALDIDPRNGGLDTIERLESSHNQKIAAAVQAMTGGGGVHHVYATEAAQVRGSLGPGVDVKHHGYIVVEPSEHYSGGRYLWEASSDPLEGAAPEPLPSWLHDLLVHDGAPVSEDGAGVREVLAPETIEDIARALPAISADDRETWLQVGMALHESIGGSQGFELWRQWSATSPKFDPRDQLRVWRSFRVRGGGGVTFRTLFKLAQESASASPAAAEAAKEPARLVLTLAQLQERAAAVAWTVKGVIPASSLGMIFGASGAFKSFVALDYALHRAWGMQWLGRKTKKAPVVYLAAEGGAGVFRRIDAWHRLHGLDWRKCPLFVVPVPLALRQDAKHLRTAVQALGVAAGDIIVDTLSQTFDGDENAASEVAPFIRTLGAELRDPLGATVTLIHHSGHVATERPRGSSAMLANLDFVFGVFRDEQQLLCTAECAKQKDGDKVEPLTFTLHRQVLGRDEDGEEISSLVARHADSAAAVLEAARAKRSGGLARLIAAIGQGTIEKEARYAFYASMDGAPDAKQKAFRRALNDACRLGVVIAEGDFLTVAAQQKGEKGPDIGH